MIIKEFVELGQRIEKIWRDKNYSEAVFPDICSDALEEARLPEKISAFEVLRWALRSDTLPEQRDLSAKFGDPPITLYNSQRFHIDVYFWLEGTTTIHQHAFCGAFQVFHGSSIHSIYDFEIEESINCHTELGRIDFLNCELLKVNDIRKILPGRDFIHALFHLDQPSATIVIRTTRSPLHLPQFDYHKPFLAINPFFDEPNTIKKLQTISALMRINAPETESLICETLSNSDFQTAYLILSTVKKHLSSNRLNQIFGHTQEKFNSFMGIVQRRYGSFSDVLPRVFEQEEKIHAITRLRSYVHDNELRFFLALLMNIEGKNRIFQMVSARFPNSDPVEKILDWIESLANTKVLDITLNNALGMEDFSAIDLIALEILLRDLPSEEEGDLLKQYGLKPSEDTRKLLHDRKNKLRQLVILSPLISQ
ncbi:MAG: hypothetical protein D6735_04315 [Acidobacteria bacterium]|nr:MAG: hypothetical protein D6735_04315 [Acidobacteriota bacterium]